MELTMNQTNLGLGNGKTGWNLPEFGIQKYATKAVESVFTPFIIVLTTRARRRLAS